MSLVFSGERLREACSDRDLTAQALAQRAECSVSAVYKWRTDRAIPGANELAAIAEALGVPLSDLYVRVSVSEGTAVPAEAAVDRG